MVYNRCMREKLKNKKALSDIVSTLLILLLVFVAVAILWVVVRNVIQQGTEQISLGKFTLDLKIEKVTVLTNSIEVKVKRNVGAGEFSGLSFIIDDGENSEIIQVKNISMAEHTERTFSLTPPTINPNNVKTVEVAPIFTLSSGKEVVGDVKDTYTIQTSSGGTTCTDTCASLNYTCGSQTICSLVQNCGTCSQTGYVCSGGHCILGSTCTDSCTSLNFECGTQTVCGSSTNCGTCPTGETCNSLGICAISCTDSCTSLNFECGTQTVCGSSTNCGTCPTGETCNSLGICAVSFSGSLLAFPGAEGFGKNTRGAYSGSSTPTVLIVDTLESASVTTGANRGSLRWALSQNYPRIILFEVGGLIEISSSMGITNPYVTIYGQTSPGDGIIIKDSYIYTETHDIIIQNIKMRAGDDPEGTDYASRDSFKVSAGSSNIVLDHMDFMWGVDEDLEIYRYNINNITISNSLIAEGLYDSYHPDLEHSMGALIQSAGNVSLYKTIIGNSENRLPYVRDSHVELVNVLTYNPTWQSIDLGCGVSANIVGSVSKKGPSSVGSESNYIARTRNDGCSSDAYQKVYVSDNIYTISDPDGVLNTNSYEVLVSSPPIPLKASSILSSSQTESYLLANAGAFYWDRDPTSARVIQYISGSTGGYIDHPSDVEGYSWIQSVTRSLTSISGYPSSNPHGDDDGDGYTNLEEWSYNLHG